MAGSLDPRYSATARTNRADPDGVAFGQVKSPLLHTLIVGVNTGGSSRLRLGA